MLARFNLRCRWRCQCVDSDWFFWHNSDGGNITWQSGASLDYSTSSGTFLGLEATGYIELNSDINVGPGGLSLSADTGYVASSSAITLNLGGPLTITAGDADQTNWFFLLPPRSPVLEI